MSKFAIDWVDTGVYNEWDGKSVFIIGGDDRIAFGITDQNEVLINFGFAIHSLGVFENIPQIPEDIDDHRNFDWDHWGKQVRMTIGNELGNFKKQKRIPVITKVETVMKDGKWHSIQDIMHGTGLPPTCDIARRIRELRDRGYDVGIKNLMGTFMYRAKKIKRTAN